MYHGPEGTQLSREEEERFQRDWKAYLSLRQVMGFPIDSNPDPSELNRYDYRGLWKARKLFDIDSEGHSPSEYKLEGHPNTYVGGYDTRTGAPLPSYTAAQDVTRNVAPLQRPSIVKSFVDAGGSRSPAEWNFIDKQGGRGWDVTPNPLYMSDIRRFFEDTFGEMVPKESFAREKMDWIAENVRAEELVDAPLKVPGIAAQMAKFAVTSGKPARIIGYRAAEIPTMSRDPVGLFIAELPELANRFADKNVFYEIEAQLAKPYVFDADRIYQASRLSLRELIDRAIQGLPVGSDPEYADLLKRIHELKREGNAPGWSGALPARHMARSYINEEMEKIAGELMTAGISYARPAVRSLRSGLEKRGYDAIISRFGDTYYETFGEALKMGEEAALFDPLSQITRITPVRGFAEARARHDLWKAYEKGNIDAATLVRLMPEPPHASRAPFGRELTSQGHIYAATKRAKRGTNMWMDEVMDMADMFHETSFLHKYGDVFAYKKGLAQAYAELTQEVGMKEQSAVDFLHHFEQMLIVEGTGFVDPNDFEMLMREYVAGSRYKKYYTAKVKESLAEAKKHGWSTGEPAHDQLPIQSILQDVFNAHEAIGGAPFPEEILVGGKMVWNKTGNLPAKAYAEMTPITMSAEELEKFDPLIDAFLGADKTFVPPSAPPSLLGQDMDVIYNALMVRLGLSPEDARAFLSESEKILTDPSGVTFSQGVAFNKKLREITKMDAAGIGESLGSSEILSMVHNTNPSVFAQDMAAMQDWAKHGHKVVLTPGSKEVATYKASEKFGNKLMADLAEATHDLIHSEAPPLADLFDEYQAFVKKVLSGKPASVDLHWFEPLQTMASGPTPDMYWTGITQGGGAMDWVYLPELGGSASAGKNFPLSSLGKTLPGSIKYITKVAGKALAAGENAKDVLYQGGHLVVEPVMSAYYVLDQKFKLDQHEMVDVVKNMIENYIKKYEVNPWDWKPWQAEAAKSLKANIKDWLDKDVENISFKDVELFLNDIADSYHEWVAAGSPQNPAEWIVEMGSEQWKAVDLFEKQWGAEKLW